MSKSEAINDAVTSPDVSTSTRDVSAFIKFLGRACSKTGPRAQLRRTLGKDPEDAYEAHPYVAPFLGDSPYPSRESAMYCVAAIFAASKAKVGERDGVNFGRWFGEAVLKSWNLDNYKTNRSSIERRFYRLARLSAAQARRELPLIFSLSGVENPALDWDLLIDDLAWWDSNRSVSKRWLQGFIQALGPNPNLKDDHSDYVSGKEP